jgi:hypothetical protein
VVTSTVVATERLDADTIRICYGGTVPEVLADGIPAVRDFDCVTNTLGPVLFNLDAFVVDAVQIAGYHRSTVAAEDRVYVKRDGPFGRRISLYRHDGIGFLAEIIVSDNVPAATEFCELEAIFMDPAGTSHVFYSSRPLLAPQIPRTVYYRQVNAAGAMNVPVVVYTYADENSQTFGFPAILGTALLAPFPAGAADRFTGSMLVIDPYTSPAPAISTVALPTQYLTLASATANSGTVHAAILGAQAYLWWLEELGLDGVTPLSRIMYTTYAGGAIPAPVVFHDQLANPAPFDAGGPMQYLSLPFMDVADPILLVGMAGMIGGVPVGPTTYYWFSIAGPAGAPAVMANQGFRRSSVLIPNHWDGCLAQDILIHMRAGPQRACCYPLILDDYTFVRAPKNSIPFRKVSAIPTPLAISGDVVVLDFQVPTGYDGLIAGLFHVYTGPGFQEGNGDIEWRLLVNKTYAVHLGRVLVTLGSRAQSYPVEGGIQIQSGQRIQYIVNVPNLSGGILPLASQIVCGLEGLFYARQ